MTIEILGMKFRVLYLIAIAVLMFFIFTNILTCTCKLSSNQMMEGLKMITGKKREGMEVKGYNDATPKYGDAVAAHETADISGSKKNIDMEQAESDRALDEEKMFVFSNTKFLPECCPSAYSTGQGCACISDRIKDHIGTRGGNN